MIGFSIKGKVKCWITHKFYCNRVDENGILDMDDGRNSQNKMESINQKLR
jgi:hypothetical protein